MFGFYNCRNDRNGIPCLVSYSLDIGALPITSSKYYDISDYQNTSPVKDFISYGLTRRIVSLYCGDIKASAVGILV